MAVQMDKPSELSSRERAQRLYNKNVELENTCRKSAHARIPSDPSIWQQIRENYEAIILEDNSFSEHHEIALALWQLHYRRIEELRAHFSAALSSNSSSATQNGKGGPARPDRLARIRSQFRTFLSEATGFYHELIVKIRAKYGLPLGYFSDDPETQTYLSKDGLKPTDIKKGLISCHRCLIYLGDLARYKGLYGDGESKTRDFAAASSYYMQASSLWPLSGNPHHQLAIVAAYNGDEFVAIYRYFRSLAVENPFSTARDNLIIAFERNRQNYSQLLEDSKTTVAKAAAPRMTGKGRGRGDATLSSKYNRNRCSPPNKERAPCIPEIFKAFCVKFIRVNGVLFTRTSLETFTDVLSTVKNDFTVLLSSSMDEKYNFGSDGAECGLFIVRLVAILIYTLHNVNKESENQSYAEILQRSVLLQNAYTAIFELMGHVVEKCLQLQDPLSSYLLPGVLIFVEWLACHPDIAAGSEATEKQDHVRLFFWNSCVSFLNRLLSSGLCSDAEDETCFFNMSEYEVGETANQLALWEDFEVRGFLPLHPSQQILDFSRKHSFGNDGRVKEKRIRAERTIAAGKAFANVVRIGQQGIYFDSNVNKFILGDESQLSTASILSSGPEIGVRTDMSQESSDGNKTNAGVQQPAVRLVEEEEDDEVIVFKPSAADKQAVGGFPALASCGNVGPVARVPVGDLEANSQLISAPENGTLPQNGFDTTLRRFTSFDNTTSQHLQPVQPNTYAWLGEQKASKVNEFKNFSLIDNGHYMNQKPQSLTTAAFSLPFSNSVHLNTGDVYSANMSKVVMPLRTNFTVPSGGDVDVCVAKSQSRLPVGSRKSPISKPARHVGPPPGFTPVASKTADDPQRGLTMKEENPLLDDYSWLDGYQMPASEKQGLGFNISTNLNGPLYNHAGEGNGMPGAISFPFPGKQASAFQAPADSHKLWQDYQCPDHLKLYEQQQQQQLGNQQPMPLPKYQGQSLWEGRFVV